MNSNQIVNNQPKKITNNNEIKSIKKLRENKNKSQSSSFKESILLSDNFLNTKTKSSTLPFNRSLTVNNLNQSIESFDSNCRINSSSSNCESGTSSSASSESGPSNNLIMTTKTTISNVPQSLSQHESVLPSNVPIIQQPQPIKSSSNLSSSNCSSLSPSMSSSLNSNKPVTNNQKNNNNCHGSVQTSYLDEKNLKLAIVDYSDILKLIKLQNSIEYQEWIAFNSNLFL